MNRKFQVGEKVRVLKNIFNDHPKGSVWRIVKYDSGSIFPYKLEQSAGSRATHGYAASEIARVNPNGSYSIF